MNKVTPTRLAVDEMRAAIDLPPIVEGTDPLAAPQADQLQEIHDRLGTWVKWSEKSIKVSLVQIAEEIVMAGFRIAFGESVGLYKILLVRGNEEGRVIVLEPCHVDAEERGKALAERWNKGWGAQATKGALGPWRFSMATHCSVRDLLSGGAI